MSDVLIKGLEMPKEIPCCYTIFPNGKVIVHWDGKLLGEAKAIELPPHGRCIDVNLLHKRLIEDVHTQDTEWLKKYKGIIYDVVTPIIVGCPTVLEASKERE